MKKDNKKISAGYHPTEEFGIRSDLDSTHPYETVDRYAGDSVNEHKELEKVNEHFAEKEISQVFNNS
ncbi:hypothetical protein GCM10008967_17060 [Bacillus carboniphilus]|uniref:DUF4025 domain-containing protein n=1 Tax=Bacillus carboniphilus TaxID=86663 RepID=A0ABN0W6R6_9BACI